MKYSKLCCAIAVLSASTLLIAQSSSSSSMYTDSDAIPGGSHSVAPATVPVPTTSARPFSKVAFGTGISPLGIQVSMTTNLTSHFNLRTSGNIFNYATSFSAKGIGADASLALKSAGTSLDIYPFHKGFRVSPGILFYSGNQLTATGSVPGGSSFTLNDQTYYSSNSTPVNGNALLNMHTNNPAFTITTGWGNTVPRKGHWSFPFELGVAFIGAPSLDVNLQGRACYDQAQTLCTDIASKTDPIALEIQSNLAVQVAKWSQNIEPLKTFPIASFGVAYSFGLRNK